MKTGFGYAGIFVAAALFLLFVYRCPVYMILGFQCPGCGITRAYMAAMQFDFSSAFAYHPLFFVAAPLTVYIVFRNKLKKPLSSNAETVILITLAVLFAAVYIYRISTGSFATV